VGQGFHTNPERINKKGQPHKLPEINAVFVESMTKEDLILLIRKAKLLGKKGNMKAIEWLFDRIYGKAKQELGFTDKEGNDVTPITFILDDRYKDNPGIST
jgi:hypothetical protein